MTDMHQKKTFIHGHRGCRGHMPENTLDGFIQAFALGADVIEFDLVLNKNHQVVISHEPFMNHITCLRPDGFPISAEESRQHNIYRMDIAEIRAYDCGSAKHPRFTTQKNFKACKPLLSELVEKINSDLQKPAGSPFLYNIEVKSTPEGDRIFHPEPAIYAKVIHREIQHLGLSDQCVVQSFDKRILQELRKLHAKYPLCLLSHDDTEPALLFEDMGFQPEYFCPVFTALNEEVVNFCRNSGTGIFTWTVNESADIMKAIAYGVDGIITDFPDRAKQKLVQSK